MKFTFSVGSSIERERARDADEYRWKSKLEQSASLSKNFAMNSSKKNLIKRPYDVHEDSYRTKPRYHR